MDYMILIFLLLSIGVGQTTYQQQAYSQSYIANGTVSDACLVKDDPRFPASYTQCQEPGTSVSVRGGVENAR